MIMLPCQHLIALGHRADAHGGRVHFARHTIRSRGFMKFLQIAVLAALKRVQLLLDEYAAALAALVDLTAGMIRTSPLWLQ